MQQSRILAFRPSPGWPQTLSLPMYSHTRTFFHNRKPSKHGVFGHMRPLKPCFLQGFARFHRSPVPCSARALTGEHIPGATLRFALATGMALWGPFWTPFWAPKSLHHEPVTFNDPPTRNAHFRLQEGPQKCPKTHLQR